MFDPRDDTRERGDDGRALAYEGPDFDPLVSEEVFYRAQAVLCGRMPVATPKQRAHPDFPLRAFVRCQSCGRGLTGSWSKGRCE